MSDTELDKSRWPPGSWDVEPDKVVWIDEATGLDCMIHRNHYGALCGYVGVPPGHPYHHKPYDETGELDVHGGITYASLCSGDICHVPEPGRPHDVWWLGFDCAHLLRDVVPGFMQYSEMGGRGTYKDIEYVRAEVTSLAAQLHN